MRRALLLLALLSGWTAAQITTGFISGRVEDTSGLPVAEAEVALTYTQTGAVRTAMTDVSGSYLFPGLEAGTYSIAVSKSGFRRATAEGVNLSSAERLAMPVVTLQVGSTNESIVIRSEVPQVQTQSAERAGVVTTAQIDALLIQGRNPTSLVSLMPGVVMSQQTNALDRDTNFNVQGNRRTANNVAIDGIPTVDIDNGFSQKLNVNMDAVSEVQVLLSNYQAEYGRNAGSNVNIVTKSGSRDFHGLGSYFKRHEQFNANNFFNNFVGADKPRYRYNTWTYNVGGPVYIPGKFNRNKDKLFFFWSQ